MRSCMYLSLAFGLRTFKSTKVARNRRGVGSSPPGPLSHRNGRGGAKALTETSFRYLFLWMLSGLLSAAAFAQESDVEARYATKRQELIDKVLIPGGIRDPKVVQAVSQTRRHEFVPENIRSEAYLDRALPIGAQQTISSPFIVSLMTEILRTKPSDRVLEIGTGSGYQAAILSPLVDSVYTIEIVGELQDRTTALLQRLGYKNIHTKTGDGYLGWPEHAPFDKIIVTLKEEGLMVIPVGERYQQMLRAFRKTNGTMVAVYERPTIFVPMTGLAESQRQVQPDGRNPKLLNGDFEDKTSENYIPHWYYEFGVRTQTDPTAPKGSQVAEFNSDQAGGPSMLLQALPLDGRHVAKVRLSGFVKTANVQLSKTFEEQPFIVLQFFDEQRNRIGYEWLGPFIGDTPWTHAKREIKIPVENREVIVMIGLFGAKGTATFDGLELEVLERRPE
jgi:protein-L-isoaspartate(D-aspartate) O-methyltransferase